jgi:hypothetical protein
MKRYLKYSKTLDDNFTREKYNLRINGFCKYDVDKQILKDNRKTLLKEYIYQGTEIKFQPNHKYNNMYESEYNERDLFLLSLNNNPTVDRKFQLLDNNYEDDSGIKEYTNINFNIYKIENLIRDSGFIIDKQNIKGNLIPLINKKRGGYRCDMCDRTHTSKSPYLVIKKQKVYFYCRGDNQQCKIIGDTNDILLDRSDKSYNNDNSEESDNNSRRSGLSDTILNYMKVEDEDDDENINEEPCNEEFKDSDIESDNKSKKKTVKERGLERFGKRLKNNGYNKFEFEYYQGSFHSNKKYEECNMRDHMDDFLREKLVVIKAGCGTGKSQLIKKLLDEKEFIAKLRIRRLDRLYGENYTYNYVKELFEDYINPENKKKIRISNSLKMFKKAKSCDELFNNCDFINREFSDTNIRILCIVPRVALGEKESKDYGLNYYKDIPLPEIPKTDRLAIQIECIDKLVPYSSSIGYNFSSGSCYAYEEEFNYDIVILDEFCQSIIHFIDNKLFETRKKYLSPILKNAGLVIAMDAFMENVHVKSLEKISDKTAFCIHNTYKRHTDKKVNVFSEPNDAIADIINELLSGKNIIVAYNSKNRGEMLKSLVEEKVQGCKILLINSEERRENQDICNVENWNKFQLIIHTSCISSGSSFTNKHFDRQYTFIDCRCVSSSTEVVQSIFRSRILNDKENSINIVLESWFENGYIDKKYNGNVLEFLRKRSYNMERKYMGVKKDINVKNDKDCESMNKKDLYTYFNDILERVKVYETGNFNKLDEEDPFFKLFCYQIHREHYSRINMLEEVLALLREKGVGFGKFKTEIVQLDTDLEGIIEKEESKKKLGGEIKQKLSEIKENEIDAIINAEEVKALDEINKKKIKNVGVVYKNFKIRQVYGYKENEIKNLNRNVIKELIRNLDVAERHNFILENEEKIIAPSGKSYDKSLTDLKARIATCMIRWAGFDGIHDINRFIEPNIEKLKEWMKEYAGEFPEIKGFKLSPIKFLNSLCEGTLLVRMKRIHKNSDHYCLVLDESFELKKEKGDDITEYNKKFSDKAETRSKFKQVKCEINSIEWHVYTKNESLTRTTTKSYYKIQGNDKYCET